MKLYRVTNERFADVFSGLGASFKDGARWNSPGIPVIYFALDMATAMLEAANYHTSPRLIPPSHCKAIYTADDSIRIEYFDSSQLPSDWNKMPYPTSTQRIGDAFLNAGKSALLYVPSAAVNLSSEYAIALANPHHDDIKHKLVLTDTLKPVYSARMFSGI
ncbi:RES family NAD+ phosphorylase [Celerinatantimonas sp. YJH-8]|uniref:RES family NAD+ phosphorylase n=1 Tax=Celerinatantimonas sp. YJH-8 TaxID=3228714 RepID=UPI0038C4252F